MASLADTYPALAAQWHRSLNGTLRPSDLVPGSNKLVHWQCATKREHGWRCAVATRVRSAVRWMKRQVLRVLPRFFYCALMASASTMTGSCAQPRQTWLGALSGATYAQSNQDRARAWQAYVGAARARLLRSCSDVRAASSSDVNAMDAQRATAIEIAVDGDGRLALSETISSSGNTQQDALSRILVADAEPYPLPPRDIQSWDGRAHIFVNVRVGQADCGMRRMDLLSLPSSPPPTRAPSPRIWPVAAALRPANAEQGQFLTAMLNYEERARSAPSRLLGADADAFAAYIGAMHKSVHREFAYAFLSHLETRQALEDPNLSTSLEMVVDPDGSLARLGVVKWSGNLAYDMGVFHAAARAAPFPVPPSRIRSPDGRTYVVWQLHRGESQCGTWNAEPYILRR